MGSITIPDWKPLVLSKWFYRWKNLWFREGHFVCPSTAFTEYLFWPRPWARNRRPLEEESSMPPSL